MKLYLQGKRKEAGNALTFVFRPETPISWCAGQYLQYTLNHTNPDARGTKRYFTISSAPFEKDILLTTRIHEQEQSSFKDALTRLQQHDMIEAEGPGGNFTLEDPQRNFVFIAGGIGITPFRSILSELQHQKIPIQGTLLYANKNDDIIFREELDYIAKENPGLVIKYIIEPKKIDKETIEKTAASYQNPLFYISGPPPMVDATEEMLSSLNVSSMHIKEDYFSGYAV